MVIPFPSIQSGNHLQVLSMTNYLKNMLEGSAAGGVRGLTLTAENYESAKSILKKRFVQPQVIINAHTEGLVKVSAVRVDNV